MIGIFTCRMFMAGSFTVASVFPLPVVSGAGVVARGFAAVVFIFMVWFVRVVVVWPWYLP